MPELLQSQSLTMLTPPEVVPHPAHFIKTEMQRRCWCVCCLSRKTGVGTEELERLLECQAEIDQRLAKALAAAFGGLDESYWLRKQEKRKEYEKAVREFQQKAGAL